MYRLHFWFVLFCLAVGLAARGVAEEYHLQDGTVLRGDVASPTDMGLVVKLDGGGFSERVAWSKFTQDTLKILAKHAKARVFAEPYVEEVLDDKAKAKREVITIKPPPRAERPAGKVSLFAALSTPAGLMILVVFFAANIFAAFEIAIYRHQPVVMTCAICAVAPIVAPLIFLALPTRVRESGHAEEPVGEEESSAASESGDRPASATSRMKNKLTSMFQPSTGGLRVAAHAKAGSGKPAAEPKMFRRGDTTFNRRFFETQFPGFFRIVPSEAEKDMVLSIKAGKNTYVGKRISRISSNEIGLQLQSGGEVSVSFADVAEVELRHKDT